MFYVLDENNNKVEALDKEGVFALLAQAINDGSLASLVADAAFVSKLKCCVSGVTNSVAFVSQATYNNLVAQGTVKENTYYFITDDPTFDEVEELVVSLNNAVVDIDEKVEKLINGTITAAKATNATNANIIKKTPITLTYNNASGREIELENGIYLIALYDSVSTYEHQTFMLYVNNVQNSVADSFYSTCCAGIDASGWYSLRYHKKKSGSGSTLYYEHNRTAMAVSGTMYIYKIAELS